MRDKFLRSCSVRCAAIAYRPTNEVDKTTALLATRDRLVSAPDFTFFSQSAFFGCQHSTTLLLFLKTSSVGKGMMLSWSKLPLLPLFFTLWSPCSTAFVPVRGTIRLPVSQLQMGLFDGFLGAGRPQNSKLDEEWEKQQEILRRRRGSPQDRDKYFEQVEKRRVEASVKQKEMWAWQTKVYKKGEDPIDEWRKRRANGQISDLDNQYGDPKEIGGIPLPGASFGVGGEFGVGGKFDNGGRFDLRLPYADQGYVDEDADFMGKIFGKKKPISKDRSPGVSRETKEVKTKKSMWPWEK